MNILVIAAAYTAAVIVGIVVMAIARKFRRLRSQLAQSQREILRLDRQCDRLDLVLRQAEPAMHAQVKARTDMEWQQATKHLDADVLPVLYPLEPAFLPISAAHGGR